jgi:hypothetical protein
MQNTLRALVLFLLLLPLAALADQGAEVKEAHRVAAKHYMDSLASGIKLTGTVDENGSPGVFEGFFYGDEWLVRETFGKLVTTNYSNKDGSWSGSNFSLPYKTEAEDAPAAASMELLSNGKYLEAPYWEHFTFISEDAGSYTFRFTPPDLPQVDLVLYGDPDDPQYLQIMSADVAFCAADPDSIHYRSFYYYSVDAQGHIYTKRETGREVDQRGESVNFSDYVVDKVEPLSTRPDELNFNIARTPVGDLSSKLTAPVEIPADTTKGYFIIPVTFAGTDKTFQFMLDTGASVSMLTSEAVKAAGLTIDIDKTAHGHGTRAQLGVGLCTTASLGAAGGPQAPLAGFPATQIPDTNKDLLDAIASYGTAGILGVEVLHQYVVKFDHPGGKLILYAPQSFRPPKQLPDLTWAASDVPNPNIEIWLDVEDLIYCKGRLADQLDGDVAIDTGLQQDLSVLRETLDMHGIKLDKVGERDNTVLGGVKKFDYVTVPSFEIGPLRMENKVASVTDDDRGTYAARGLLGFIGITLFQDGPVTLDLFNQRMYIEPPAKLGYFPGLMPPPLQQSGNDTQDKDKEKDKDKDKDKNQSGGEQPGKTKLPINIGALLNRHLG